MHNLDYLLKPKTIALIGASAREGSVGLALAGNLLTSAVEVFFVNLKRDKILGRKCFASISDIKSEIDLAIIAVPQKAVLKVSQEVISKKAKAAIIISAGFAEAGRAGALLQKQVGDLFAQAGIPLLGPNCMGAINSSAGLNASFAQNGLPQKGSIAFLSQSGALINAVIAKYGFSVVVSLGNSVNLEAVDFFDYFLRDKNTAVLALYLEGLRDGQKFIAKARQFIAKKPIIVLKGGRGKQGAKAVALHTANLAGEAEVYSAAFRKAGVIEVATLEELFAVAQFFVQIPQIQPWNEFTSFQVLTNAGALGVLLADWFSFYQIPSPEIRDLRGDVLPEPFEKSIEETLRQKQVDVVVVCLTLQAMTNGFAFANVLLRAQKKFPTKNIIALLPGWVSEEKALRFLQGKIPVFEEPKLLALCIKSLILRHNFI